jgi:hypothetical protein
MGLTVVNYLQLWRVQSIGGGMECVFSALLSVCIRHALLYSIAPHLVRSILFKSDVFLCSVCLELLSRVNVAD